MDRARDALDLLAASFEALDRSEQVTDVLGPGMARLFGVERVSLGRFGTGEVRSYVPDLVVVRDPHVTARMRAEHPTTVHALSRDPRTSFRLSDIAPPSRLRSMRVYHEYMAPAGVKYQLFSTLGRRAAAAPFVALSRPDGDFSEQDRDLLDRMAAPLGHLLLSALPPAAPPPALTARQREIMALVERGCTNAEVARALHISAATVKKHMEHILARYDVTSRAGAVAAWLREREAALSSGA